MEFFALLNELTFQFELKDTDSLVNSQIELMLVPDAHSIFDRKMCTRIIPVRLCRKLRERQKIDTVSFLQDVKIAVTSAEANDIYADNIKYLSLRSAENFGATIEAYQSPDEFDQCDGMATPTPGITIRQQTRKPFGLAYRTIVGNDTQSNDHGYQIHLIYNATAAPSEKAYQTVNESPEAITLSWEISTTPIAIADHPELKPTAHITIDSTKVDATKLESFLAIIYGSTQANARLPLPGEVISHFA